MTSTVSGAGGSDTGGSPGPTAGSAGESTGGVSGSSVGGATPTSGATNGGSSSGNGGSVSAGSDAGGQPSEDTTLVDDMEDTNAQITEAGGRNGFWYVGHDMTPAGMQTPSSSKFEMFELTPGERADSTYSAYMQVSGFTDWGSVIGFNLFEQAGVKAYDASEFCGVQFWGKAIANTGLRFRLPDGDTHQAGGVCKETGAANTLCFDHFSAPITLTPSWKSFSVTFASLQQVGTGYHPADKKFRADQLYAMEWALPGAGGKAFEIWIDDVSLVSCP